jgi:membrane protein DedA with SNARE-associated domain
VAKGRVAVETFLIKYGLLAVFLSAMAEADVVPVVTGVVAHLGYFNFAKAVAVASAGAFAGDCVWFWIGRRHSEWIRNSRIYLRAAKATENLDRRLGVWQIPASHIIYGTRIATMTFSGLKKVPFTTFAMMDILGCVLFTTTFATLGFLFSSSASLIIGRVKRVELFLPIVVIVTALVFHLVKLIAQRQTEAVRKTSDEHN